jgi:hypothetical protein
MKTPRLRNAVIATVVGAGGLFLSDNFWAATNPSLMTQAGAVIGRPLTPFSVAGVARRTARRAVWAGAIAGGAYGYGYGYGYPYGYGYSSGYGYPSYNYGYSSDYSYPSSAYGYPSYSSGYGYPNYGYGYTYPYGASYGYYRPWRWRRWY